MRKMKINYWSAENWISDPNLLSYKDYNSDLYIKTILSQYKEQTPKIETIEIETINRCNNNCSFCPVSVGNDIREMKKMPDELFYRIIDELATMNYSGYLSLFSNNEPLIDVRIIDFVKYAKEKLPNAKHALLTNGKLLTKDKYLALIQCLDYFIIDNYDDAFELMDIVKEIQDIDIEAYGNCYVCVEVRKKNQILASRGGISPNKDEKGEYHSACVLPFTQMIIRPDGKVSKCCQDAYGLMTLADVSVEGVEGAWNSKAYKHTRERMMDEGRMPVKGCKECDIFGLYNYYPLQWRVAYTNAFINMVWDAKRLGKKIIVDSEINENILYLLKMNGIYVDATIEEEELLLENRFYIFDRYDWKLLKQFEPHETGSKFTVFEGVYGFWSDEKGISIDTSMDIMMQVKKAEKNKKLVVFGAGRNARILQEKYNLDIQYYVDNSKEKIGQEYLEKKIKAVSDIGKEDFVLVAANDYKRIKKQLVECGINSQQILNGNKLI